MHIRFLLLSLLVAPAAAQSFLIAGPGGTFTSLSAAVAAANDGDAIEVRGSHDVSGLHIDKSLRIFGTNAGLHGSPLTVTVPAGKQLELASLTLGTFFAPYTTVQLSSVNQLVRDIANIGATITAQTIDLRLRSPLGTLGAIVVGFPADRTVLPGIGAAWLDPQTMCIAVLGVQDGNLGWSAALPQAPGRFAPHYRWQAATFGNGAVSLSQPGALLLR